jgi:tRNA pseudouridine32 synthase/23S rRNA pseudouridine746 synthase
MRHDATSIRARLLYEDAAMAVLDKPAGIAVHRGPKGGETLDDYLPFLAAPGGARPELAHRLDRETSGCLVIGRTKLALRRLGDAFRDGKVEKTYLALVCGAVVAPEGAIDLPLARRDHDRRSWWMKVDPSGDPSRTRYRRIGAGEGLTLLALAPETGRTHQLRVHCAAMGWPIAGDRVYGGDRASAAAHRLQLHAARIVLPHPQDGRRLRVAAPLPRDMADLVAAIGLEPAGLSETAEAP